MLKNLLAFEMWYECAQLAKAPHCTCCYCFESNTSMFRLVIFLMQTVIRSLDASALLLHVMTLVPESQLGTLSALFGSM